LCQSSSQNPGCEINFLWDLWHKGEQFMFIFSLCLLVMVILELDVSPLARTMKGRFTNILLLTSFVPAAIREIIVD
jgi:hypothetical protein